MFNIVMKYLGGKQRLGKQIAPVLKQILTKYKDVYHINKYIEPFCGALGVLRNMTDIPLKIYASDYHPDLIAMWLSVKRGTLDPPGHISEPEYLYYKHEVPSPNPMKGFIGFGSSFGGRYFGAYAQKYVNNRNENFCLEAKRSVEKIHPLLDNVDFSCKSYLDLHPSQALIYCDPPYQKTKFPIKYRRDVKHYDVFDNQEFWDTMRRWSKDNIVIISETHAPSDFIEIWQKDKLRTLCQSKKTRYKTVQENTKVMEKLFVHKTSKILDDTEIFI